jgi:hypothetical protein
MYAFVDDFETNSKRDEQLIKFNANRLWKTVYLFRR